MLTNTARMKDIHSDHKRGDFTSSGKARTTERLAELELSLLAAGALDHQVKTDVSIIIGWASLLDDKWGELSDRQRRDAIQVIRRRAQSLATAATTRLDRVASAWTARGEAETSVGDLAAEVRLVTKEVAMASLSHRVRYVGERQLTCEFDPAGVERVVLQLLENAVRYSPSGSEVQAGVRRDGGDAVIDVVDQGPGVRADIDLFAPFVRSSTSAGGSGLGLFVARETVQSMGGTIRAWSNTPVGSTFRIRLPLGGGS